MLQTWCTALIPITARCKFPGFAGVKLESRSDTGPSTKSTLYTFLLCNLLFFPLSWLYCFIQLRDRMSRKQLKELFAANLKHTASERCRRKNLLKQITGCLPPCHVRKLNSFISSCARTIGTTALLPYDVRWCPWPRFTYIKVKASFPGFPRTPVDREQTNSLPLPNTSPSVGWKPLQMHPSLSADEKHTHVTRFD